MSKLHNRYYFILFSRATEVGATLLFTFWVYDSILKGDPWYLIVVYSLAAAANSWSFYMGMRRNVVQFVFRRVHNCPGCNSFEYFIEYTLSFRTSSRVQCAIVHCCKCNDTSVFTCKCTPARCDLRVDCLTMAQIRVPYLYPRQWVGIEEE
jgi:hypothetical protein